MKFAIIFYIALGLVLSVFIGVKYECTSTVDVLPTYYGSPFIFKEKSLGSSLESFYSISGLIMNLLIWTLLLLIINEIIQIFNKKKWISTPYKIITGLLIAFSTLSIFFHYHLLADGFDINSNYWYWDINTKTKEWGATCEGKLTFLQT